MNEVIGGKVYLTSQPLSMDVEERLKKQGFWGVGVFDEETDKVFYKNVGEPKSLDQCKCVVGLKKFKDAVINMLKSKGVNVYAN